MKSELTIRLVTFPRDIADDNLEQPGNGVTIETFTVVQECVCSVVAEHDEDVDPADWDWPAVLGIDQVRSYEVEDCLPVKEDTRP